MTGNPQRAFTLVSEIIAEQVEWLWKGRVPLKEVSILDGDPAGSKSSLTLDLAARLSSGRGMPLDEPCVAAGVVLLGVEDSVSKTVRPRLEAAGADLSRIAVIADQITIPNDLAVIGQAIAAVQAKLVVIDPIMAYLGRDANNDQAVRKALTPLRVFAERAVVDGGRPVAGLVNRPKVGELDAGWRPGARHSVYSSVR